MTICTHNRMRLLSGVVDEAVKLSTPGQIVLKTWGELAEHYPHARLDAFVVMPNHVHGIMMLVCDSAEAGLKPAATTRHALPEVVRAVI